MTRARSYSGSGVGPTSKSDSGVFTFSAGCDRLRPERPRHNSPGRSAFCVAPGQISNELQALKGRERKHSAPGVSIAHVAFIVPDLVLLQESSVFVLESSHPVVFRLLGDVRSYPGHFRLGYRETAITGLPVEVTEAGAKRLQPSGILRPFRAPLYDRSEARGYAKNARPGLLCLGLSGRRM